MKMYRTFDECYAHSSDNMASIIKEVMDCFNDGDYADPEGYASEEGEEIYALLLSWLSGKWTREFKSKFEKESNWIWVKHILEPYSNFDMVLAEDKNVVNSVLHILHINIPDIRESAIEFLSVNFDISDRKTAHPSYEGIVLTGVDAVPEEWKKVIRETVSDLDVSLDIRMMWFYSHLYNENYDYSIAEDINVEVGGLNKSEINLAVDRINSLHFIYKK